MLAGLPGATLAGGVTPALAAPLGVKWMRGVSSPGTLARLDRVGVLRIGSPAARNVLVLIRFLGQVTRAR